MIMNVKESAIEIVLSFLSGAVVVNSRGALRGQLFTSLPVMSDVYQPITTLLLLRMLPGAGAAGQ